MKSTIAACAIALLVTAANAHMSMANPHPFTTGEANYPDSSPLDPTGADYPCKLKQVNGFTRKDVTVLRAGDTLDLNFKGTAVHGGGTCQLSLTKDLIPTPNSVFKVIYSIEGGCPGVQQGRPNNYSIPIPQDAPDGDYTFAWTWFNNLGNREMYMNCAPITMTGSLGTDASFNALPDIASFNLRNRNACKTEDSRDVKLPVPGKYLLKVQGLKDAVGPKNCDSFPLTAGSHESVESTPGSVNVVSVAPSPAIAAPYSNSTATQISPVTPTTSAINSSDRSGTAGIPYVNLPSCPVDGVVVCSADGSQFGLCNWGHVTMMPVALGTTCSNGAILKRSAKFRL